VTGGLTALYAAPLALLIVGLAGAIARQRWKKRIGLGDGGDKELQRLIRVHGNLTEVAPIGILLLLVGELTGLGVMLLHGAGAALLAGRVLHAVGLARHGGSSFGRFTGSALSWGAIIVLAIALLLAALTRQVEFI
jgi:uncharacterized membrane protein YecN with MAPEG domain